MPCMADAAPLPAPEQRSSVGEKAIMRPPSGTSGSGMSAIIVALIASVTSIATAGITAYVTIHTTVADANAGQARIIEQNRQQANDQINRLSRATAGPLSEGQKLCRVLQGHTWRDGVIVPMDWTVSVCQDYQKKSGGSAYQLGCIYSDGTTLGGENGTFPSPNCGWR